MAEAASPDFLHVGTDGVVVRVQQAIYGDQAVAAALHKFTDRAFVHMELTPDGWILLRVMTRGEQDSRSLAGELANELLDQLLRKRLQEETEPIRRLLLAQAFSRTNILHSELDEADPRADPLHVKEPEPPFRAR